VTPDDVRAVAPDCLRHRIVLSYEANAARKTTDEVVSELVKVVAVA
jgi:MoxR-like ATPase